MYVLAVTKLVRFILVLFNTIKTAFIIPTIDHVCYLHEQCINDLIKKKTTVETGINTYENR